ncbi:hypothetical protein [Plantactinospora sp. GCM10030261]|uniref:Rv0361 family membrane protein n=1 Tax=Plantactinospora sp. GCM10030261 TaxID=3273420 RepID=UPI0036100AE1
MASEGAAAYPARRRSVWRVALVATGLILLVCCIGAAGLGVWNLQALRGTEEPVRAAADAFLHDVSAGNAGHAYDELCPASRQRWTRDEFVRRTGGLDAVLRYTIGTVSVATKDGRPHGTVTVDVVRRTGAVERRTLDVVQDGRTWRVCGDTPI